MSNILNPCGAPAGGHAGYGKGADAGTEALEEATSHSEPVSKQTKGTDDAPQSQKSSKVGE